MIPKALLEKVRRGTELISVGKKHGKHSLPQDVIQEALFQKAKEGKTVIRLKGGDPFLFGRGGEEAIFLRSHGVFVEVVPGVSSVIAVPALDGIPVTRRHLAMTFAVAPGHVTEDNDPIPVPDADTLVYVMCVSDLSKTVRNILRKRKGTTPCALIENGATPRERVIVGLLNNIIQKARTARLKAPSIFIVGPVVKLRESLVPLQD